MSRRRAVCKKEHFQIMGGFILYEHMKSRPVTTLEQLGTRLLELAFEVEILARIMSLHRKSL